MKKIGRNDLCPCGSKKKYKNCHLGKPLPKGLMEGVYKKEIQNFDELIQTFSPNPIVSLLAILQLIPINHGYNEIFEELSSKALKHIKSIDSGPYALYPVLSNVIKKEGDCAFTDEPANAFTECAVFFEGNFIVYPGITLNGTEILNQLLECIFIEDNLFPPGFKSLIKSAANFLLLLSDLVAKGFGHERYMFEEMNKEIFIPDRDSYLQQFHKVKFSYAFINNICKDYKIDPIILSHLTVTVDEVNLAKDSLQDNVVLYKPIIDLDDNYIVYMPTTIVESLLNYISDQAKKFNCSQELISHFQKHQLNKVCDALLFMGWQLTNITLPHDTNRILWSELVFQIDTQKYGYVCLIPTNQDHHDHIAREKQVIAYLENRNAEQPFQILSLFVLSELGNEVFFIPEPTGKHLSLTFRFSELIALAYSKNQDILSFWKFAKAFNSAKVKSKIISVGGLLDAYAIFDNNKGSLFHPSELNPEGRLLAIPPGYGNDFIRNVQKRRDEHAARMFINNQMAYAKVIRYKDYAPIYKLKDAHVDFRLVIETYKMPIWITNYRQGLQFQKNWAHDVCEAVAFWLDRMKKCLVDFLGKLSFISFEIEIVADDKLSEVTDFAIKEIDSSEVKINIEIIPPRIRLYIPFEFMYLVRRPDNLADKVLMNAVLDGIFKYILEAGEKETISHERRSEIVEEILQPETAKMMLFTDINSNIQVDSRNLPPIRYIQDPDVSYILENIVNWLPLDYHIPAKITDVNDKIKLCDNVVDSLLDKLSMELRVFDGEKLLDMLIRQNEKCIQIREIQFIIIPSKIACFSNFEKEVEYTTKHEEDIVNTFHAVRTLIEFVASDIPRGSKRPNFDDIDYLLALTNQITSWGALSEAMRSGISNPEMGLLPSNRIGIDKTWENQNLSSYRSAKIELDVYQYIENFKSRYRPELRFRKALPEDEKDVLNEAFFAEFRITLNDLIHLVNSLINKGLKEVKACMILAESELIDIVKAEYPGLPDDIIFIGLDLLSLLERKSLKFPPEGYSSQDIFPWRYTRQLSYLRKPLVKVKTGEKTSYCYGYRHLDLFLDNLLFLLHSGKLPETNSEKMDTWIGKILAEKGKPFRNTVKNWFVENTDFRVIEYEVKMEPKGHIITEKNYGDIDLMVIDENNLIIYSFECKNGISSRNIHEMKVELDLYLGREGNAKKAKIKKHFERDKWLKNHSSALSRLVVEPEKYQIISIVISSEEMSLIHLANERLLLPVISFARLKKDGINVLTQFST